MKQVTIETLQKMKQQGEKIAALTAYDASFAHQISKAGVEVMLVGDSLGNVIQGHDTTVPVTVADMCYHTAAVCRGNINSLIISDLSFMSYRSIEMALESATSLMQAGAQVVKLEGGAWLTETIQQLTERGIPTCGHIGLTPQSVHALGGFKVQGKTETQREKIVNDAIALETAGVKLLVVECVPATLAEEITNQVNIPVIGIGAGSKTDGQVLVTYDALGMSVGGYPKFAKNFMADSYSIQEAINKYVVEVKSEVFPSISHRVAA